MKDILGKLLISVMGVAMLCSCVKVMALSKELSDSMESVSYLTESNKGYSEALSYYQDSVESEIEGYTTRIAYQNKEIDELKFAIQNSDAGDVILANTFTRDEVDLLSRCEQAEAGEKSYESQRIVTRVILNRVASADFPNTIEEVIYDHRWGVYQFSVVPDGRIKEKATKETIQNVKDELLYNETEVPRNVLFFHSTRIDSEVNRLVWKRVEGTTFTY